MKLIIDILEDTYLLCKSLPMDAIQKAIASGIPVSTEGDLISREALKKAMEQADKEAIDYEILAGMYEHLVRNAPTVPLRLMTVEECAGHTIDYAMGWKACIEWIKKGCAE